MEEADAILWGATGGPETKEVPAAARKAGSLLGMRSKYDLYANLRPIVANPALAESAPLKARVLKDVDFVIIRELTSGIYFGEPRGNRNAGRRTASRFQHRAIHHQSGSSRGARRFRTGADAEGQGLFGGQGERPGNQRAVARRSHCAARRGILRRRTQPPLCRQRPPCRSSANRRSST